MNFRASSCVWSLGLNHWTRCRLILKSSHHAYRIASSVPNLMPTILVKDIQSHVIFPKRFYASKNKVKGSSKKHHTKINESALAEVIDVQTLRHIMETAVETMKDSYVKQLSIRTAGGSIESLSVEFEGDTYEIQEIAQISRKGQQTIIINMTSFPQMTKTVMDTLRKSNLNLNPQQDGTTIFVPIPKVTKEHREILAKRAKELFITCRDTVRKTQEKYVTDLKDAKMDANVRYSAIDQIRAMGDLYVEQAESMMKTKRDELLGAQ